MDQAASTLCTAGNALFFDCRTYAAEQVRFDTSGAGLEILVLDTKTPHALVDSEYAARRASCEEAARLLGVAALRDVTDLGARAGAAFRSGDAAPGTPRGQRERPGAGGCRGAAGGPDRRPGAAAGRLARVRCATTSRSPCRRSTSPSKRRAPPVPSARG
mgnify:CR=1 FL=1